MGTIKDIKDNINKIKNCPCLKNMPKLPELPKMPTIPIMIDFTFLDKLHDLGIPVPSTLLKHPLIQIDEPLLPEFKGFPECNCPPDCPCRKLMNPKYDATNEKTYSDKSTS